MLVNCQEGFYIRAIGFTGDAVFANGTIRVMWTDGPGAEQHYLSKPSNCPNNREHFSGQLELRNFQTGPHAHARARITLPVYSSLIP
ncbi:MAG: hypothetical protein OXQ29_03025 [Rhodospirillaceae bacterium]|nr:hypothetical protein [Rhodospirillaceae bacterium]